MPRWVRFLFAWGAASYGFTLWQEHVAQQKAAAAVKRHGKPLLQLDSQQALKRLASYPDQHFGAVLVGGLLTRAADPAAIMAQLRRVAVEVYVTVPPAWAIQAWLPAQRWVEAIDKRCLKPLWKNPNPPEQCVPIRDDSGS